ncbi:MAG: hypothetical protein EOP04_08865 [Proteobacteria bacterium]|nr:MAG: hypothetical protein EOP04_08865 [Pseudomonadota bacterium]
MKLALSAVISALLIQFSAQAAILEVTPSDQKLQGVTLGSKAISTTTGKSTNLEFVNAGTRVKKILVIKADVYTIQLFVDQKAKFIKTPRDADFEIDMRSLKSISNLGVVALKLDFLRDLSADKIVDSFQDALHANHFEVSSDDGLKRVLAAIKKGGAVQKGESISIVGVNGADKDQLYVENSKGVSENVEGESQLIEKMLSIWLGTPADGKLEELKQELTR